MSRAVDLAGVTGEATLIEYRQRLDFADLFSIWGKSEAAVVKVDLGIEAPQLRPGCMYFLAPTYLH